jgi:hypothetical protein
MKKAVFFIFGLILAVMPYLSEAQLTTTNLPIVKISTPTAINSTTQQGTIDIINNASGTNNINDAATFSGMIGIKYRGTTAYPKYNYNFETWSTPNVNLDTALLGLPAENDWVLMSAYTDRSLMRSTLSFKLWESMLRYTGRMRYCELMVNNQYQGIYLFGEKIKRDNNRLDIATLNVADNFGDELTGGYIWKLDNGAGSGWTSTIAPPYAAASQTVSFLHEYPDPSDLTPVQASYIKAYVDSFEFAMNSANFQDTSVGWRRFGAVGSFVDYMIMQELSRNFDGYRQNMYMYKDKLKKLRPGPLWNMELAWRNTSDCGSAADTGFTWHLGATCPNESKLAPFWWSKLYTDTAFVRELKCTYSNYRKTGQALDTVKIFYIVDSIAATLFAQGAVLRNFNQWPIWGVPIVNEPTPMAATYGQEVANLKTFIRNRLAWLDTRWTLNGGCPFPLLAPSPELNQLISVYPVPTSGDVQIVLGDFKARSLQLELCNLQGQVLKQDLMPLARYSLSMHDVTPGVYFIRLTDLATNSHYIRKVIKN